MPIIGPGAFPALKRTCKTCMREYINLKVSVNLNTRLADRLVCEYCHQPIIFLPDRRNRIDCETGDDIFVTYHLWCYDEILLGKVTAHTRALMDELQEKYGDI